MAEFGSQITTLKNSIETLETFQTNTEQKLTDLQASKTEVWTIFQAILIGEWLSVSSVI